jgi:hypothetical protein
LQIGSSVDRLPNGQQELGGQNLVDNAVGRIPLFSVPASPIDAGGVPLFASGRERLAECFDAAASQIIDFRKKRPHGTGWRRGQIPQGLQLFQVSSGGTIGMQDIGEPPLDLWRHGKAVPVDEAKDGWKVGSLLSTFSFRSTVSMNGRQ